MQGIGEPPLSLAASVFFAIKYAIESARKDAGVTGPFNLESPATAERIRMACVDHLTAQVGNIPILKSLHSLAMIQRIQHEVLYPTTFLLTYRTSSRSSLHFFRLFLTLLSLIS